VTLTLERQGRRSAFRRQARVQLARKQGRIVTATSCADVDAARDRLVPFCQAVDTAAAQSYGAEHLRYIADVLEKVERGEIKRLILEVPVRHWKSSIASEKFVAWYLGRNPKKSVIACSFGSDLVEQFSESIRSTINSEEFSTIFPGVGFKHGSKRKDAWALKGAYRLSYRAAGVGGPLTGTGGDLIVVDDPMADYQAVATQEARDKAWRWYQTKLRTRSNPDGGIVVIMSRWHEDDLIGRLKAGMAEGGEQWTVIRLPAIAEEDDPMGRAAGDALWPEMWPIEALIEARKSVGGLGWASLYQQSPKPDTGVILDSGKIIRIDRDLICMPGQRREIWHEYVITKAVRYWDLAFSEAKGADAMAGVLCGMDTHNRFIILDVVHLRGRWPINKHKLMDTALADPAGVVQIVESNGTQLGYAQDIKDDVRMRMRHVRGFDPGKTGNKETRASMWGSRLDDKVIHAVTAPWLATTCSQIDCFGAKGSHDDIVDGISGGWNALYSSGRSGLVSV